MVWSWGKCLQVSLLLLYLFRVTYIFSKTIDAFAASEYTIDTSNIAWPAAASKYKNAPNYADEVAKGPNSTDYLLYQVLFKIMFVWLRQSINWHRFDIE